jgi:hypothetical protein
MSFMTTRVTPTRRPMRVMGPPRTGGSSSEELKVP